MIRLPGIRVWPVEAKGRPHRLLRLAIISALLSVILASVSIFWLKQPVANTEKTTITNLNQARRKIHNDFSGLLELLQKDRLNWRLIPGLKIPGPGLNFSRVAV